MLFALFPASEAFAQERECAKGSRLAHSIGSRTKRSGGHVIRADESQQPFSGKPDKQDDQQSGAAGRA